VIAKTLHVNTVKTAKISRIIQPYRGFANVVKRAACQGQRLLQAFKNLPSLRLNATCHHFTLVIGWHLTRHKYKIACSRCW
jgi:hypothetical protein